MMTKNPGPVELTVVLVAQNHNPTILNPDFLKYNHIVPENWSLKEKPICLEPMARVAFENGIQITAELDKVIFLEPIRNDKEIEKIKIPEIAIKYINTLPHVKYMAVGINPKGHLSFATENEAQNFIMGTFVNKNTWVHFDHTPNNVGFKFSYKLEKTVLTLSIEASLFNIPSEKPVPVVLFAANFHHNIIGDTQDTKLNNLSAIIKDWRKDVDTYREFVTKLIAG
jgi:hypothetical protein